MSIFSSTGFFQTDAIVYTELRWAYDHRELLFHWQNNHNKEENGNRPIPWLYKTRNIDE